MVLKLFSKTTHRDLHKMFTAHVSATNKRFGADKSQAKPIHLDRTWHFVGAYFKRETQRPDQRTIFRDMAVQV